MAAAAVSRSFVYLKGTDISMTFTAIKWYTYMLHVLAPYAMSENECYTPLSADDMHIHNACQSCGYIDVCIGMQLVSAP